MVQKITNPLLNMNCSIEKIDPLRLGLVVPKVTQVKKWGNSSQDITVWAAFQWHGIWLGIDFRASSIYKQINDNSCFYERYQGPNTSSTFCLKKCIKGSKTRWLYERKKSWKKKNKQKNFHLKRWNSAYISPRESGSSISKDWQSVPLYLNNHFYYLVEFFILWSMREGKTCFNRWQCEGFRQDRLFQN